MKNLFFLFAFLIGSLGVKGQVDQKEEISRELTSRLFYQLQNNELKDSVAVYTFTITIEITNGDKMPIVANVHSSDQLAYKVFPNLDTLRSVDFKKLRFRSKKVRLVLPTAIVIKAHNGSIKPETLQMTDVSNVLYKMLRVEDPNLLSDIYLNPFVIEVDLSAY